MSIILEALRKSEADRHQESLPENLKTQQALLYKNNSQRYRWPAYLSFLLLFNLLLLGWFLVQKSTEQEDLKASVAKVDEAQIKQTEQSDSVIADIIETQVASPVSRQSTGQTRASDLSVARSVLAEQPLRRQPVVTIPQFSVDPDSSKASLNQPELIEPTQPIARDGITASAAGNAKDLNAAAATVDQLETASNQHSNDSAKLDSSLDTHVSTSGQNDGAADVLHIDELERSFQNTLPRLVFNSHIYSKKAANRRVMINDNFLREGEGFAGIRVVEITPNGVVLEKQQRQFLVPVVRNWSPNT